MTDTHDTLKRLGTDYTDGYGLAPIPSAIDDEVRDVVTSFFALDPSQRQEMRAAMRYAHGFVFIAFAERMASRAVRENRSEYLPQGLFALRLASELVYVKEALPVVSLLYRSMEILGLNARDISPRPDGSAQNEFDRFVAGFLSRTDDDRRIEAMGYIEGKDQDGFRYQWTL